MSMTRGLEGLPNELLLRVFEYMNSHDNYSLSRVALVSRAVHEAATKLLYHSVAIDTERRLRLFSHLLEGGTAPRSPLKLVRHLSLWTSYVGWQRDRAGRIVDACPNLLSIQARASVLTRHCTSKRSYGTVFVWMVATDWDRLQLGGTPRTGMDFTSTTHLHIHWLDYLRLAAQPLALFTVRAFPSLRVLSGGLNVDLAKTRNVEFFVSISRMLLALPCIERVTYLVNHDQLPNCAVFQACADERLYVKAQDYAGDMDVALALWLDASRGVRNVWKDGVSVMPRLVAERVCGTRRGPTPAADVP